VPEELPVLSANADVTAVASPDPVALAALSALDDDWTTPSASPMPEADPAASTNGAPMPVASLDPAALPAADAELPDPRNPRIRDMR
jgi:hypothetical protein